MLRTADKRLFVGERLSRVTRPYVVSAAESSGKVGTTASGTPNTKGSWAEVIASTSIDADGFTVQTYNTSGSTRDTLIDIGIGGAGSEVAIVSNLQLSHGTSVGQGRSIPFPIAIPAGTRIAWRNQSTVASTVIVMTLILQKSNMLRRMGFRRCETYGAVTADSGGTGVDPGGSANTKGAWSELTAATSFDIGALLVVVGTRANSAVDASHEQLLDIGVGAASSEVVVLPDMALRASAVTDLYQPEFGFYFVDIDAGSRIAARSEDNQTDATDRLLDVEAIGFGW